MRRFASVLVALLLVSLAGCAGQAGRDTQSARGQGFQEHVFRTRMFSLYGLLRPGSADAKTLHVYIEGDGRAWLTPSCPSNDPTPRNAVGLRLAMADHGTAAVLYLARPCQYVGGADRRNCTVRYWTTARLSENVISSMDEAVSQAKKLARAERVVLVGYSGGGGVAALLATRRDDVAFLGTVAGLVDTETWTRLLHVSPLSASLNPIDRAALLRNLPQRHMSSRVDKAVPPAVSDGFCRAVGRPESCIVVNGIEHGGDWQNVWNYDYAAE